jgi:hypothetical protein
LGLGFGVWEAALVRDLQVVQPFILDLSSIANSNVSLARPACYPEFHLSCLPSLRSLVLPLT